MPDTPASTRSPAMTLLTHVWTHRSRAVHASPTLTKEGMRDALYLAMKMGLLFAPGDFRWLMTNETPSYYDTSPFGFRAYVTVNNAKNYGEEFYIAAVREHHITACQSFEVWKGRRPFFVNGTRLHLGAELVWEGQRMFVTSFDDDAHTLTACRYANVTTRFHGRHAFASGEGVPFHRRTLTHAMLASQAKTKRSYGATTTMSPA